MSVRHDAIGQQMLDFGEHRHPMPPKPELLLLIWAGPRRRSAVIGACEDLIGKCRGVFISCRAVSDDKGLATELAAFAESGTVWLVVDYEHHEAEFTATVENLRGCISRIVCFSNSQLLVKPGSGREGEFARLLRRLHAGKPLHHRQKRLSAEDDAFYRVRSSLYGLIDSIR